MADSADMTNTELDALDKQHQNGTEPEPDESSDAPAAAAQNNTKWSNRRPSPDEDIFGRITGGGRDNMEVVVTASDDPKDYLVRSYLPPRTIRLTIIQMSQMHGCVMGSINPMGDNTMLYHAVRSEDNPKSNSMMMYRDIMIGRRENEQSRRDNMLSRFSTLNNEQVTPSP